LLAVKFNLGEFFIDFCLTNLFAKSSGSIL
jgi:hypothetical protein